MLVTELCLELLCPSFFCFGEGRKGKRNNACPLTSWGGDIPPPFVGVSNKQLCFHKLSSKVFGHGGCVWTWPLVQMCDSLKSSHSLSVFSVNLSLSFSHTSVSHCLFLTFCVSLFIACVHCTYIMLLCQSGRQSQSQLWLCFPVSQARCGITSWHLPALPSSPSLLDHVSTHSRSCYELTYKSSTTQPLSYFFYTSNVSCPNAKTLLICLIQVQGY